MRILLINCVSDTPEVNLYFGLHNTGVNLRIILDPRDTAYEALQAGGIPVLKATIRNRFDFKFDKLLRKEIEEFKPDVIHAPTSRGIASAIRVSKGKDIKLVTYRGTMGNLSRWSLEARLAHLHPRVDAICCNCHAVKEYMLSVGVDDSKLPVIYKGHDPSWYQTNVPYSRSDFSIPDSAFVVGCIANIRPLKGVDILVEAIAGLRDLDRPIVCLLIGDSGDGKLESYVSKHGLSDRVRFLGFRQDVSKLLPLCDVTVMPSVRREGFPRAIIESYAAKVPVICTNVGGMPEIVKDGETGIVVKPGLVPDLIMALTAVASDPDRYKKAGDAGHQLIQEKLSLRGYVEKTIDLYKDLTQ